MAQGTGIQWTDATWPIVQGCTPVSPGCANCYVPRTLIRHVYNPNPKISLPVMGLVEQEPCLRFTGKVALREDRMSWPLKWRKPSMIFVPSHGDLFHDAVPDDFILRTFDVMRRCTWAGGQDGGKIKGNGHTFQVLTKRAQRMADFSERLRWDGEKLFLGDSGGTLALPPNPQIWMGVSVEDQRRFDERGPILLKCPAAVRFLSCEPLLGPLDFHFGCTPEDMEWRREHDVNYDATCFDWGITGGESGPKSRPCHVEWIESIVKQYRTSGVACFVKQLGSKPFLADGSDPNGWPTIGGPVDWETGNVSLNDSHGGDPDEWPEHLRVREFPEAVNA